MRAEAFVQHLDDVTGSFNGWNARCPAHDDRSASLVVSVGEDERVLIHCHAGCAAEEIVRALGFELRHLYAGVEVEPTVDELAEYKRLNPQFLRDLGLHDIENCGGVGIPYYDAAGQQVAVKRRTALAAKNGSRWPAGQHLLAYGLWLRDPMLAQSRWALLVEGESDCWTAWSHGQPALGVPGATSAGSTLTPDVLAVLDRLYIVKEPDIGGDAFVSGVQRALTSAAWSGSAFVVQLPGAKDINEFHQQHGVGFVQALRSALAQAVPLTDAVTVVSGEWATPRPLSSANLIVPRFDEEALLPASLRPWLTDISQRTGSPAEYAAVTALVALGTVVGRKLSIRPKERDDWQKVPNLWGAVIGPPGKLKTPAVRAALAPVQQLDQELQAQQAAASRDHDFELMVAKARRDDLTQKIREAIKNDRDPNSLRAELESITDPSTSVRQLIVNDTTAEKLADILKANPNGILVYRDELTGFFALLRREGREGERQFYLEA